MTEPHRRGDGHGMGRGSFSGILIAGQKPAHMICAQRLFRRARAIDDGEMMETHLEHQTGRNRKQPLIRRNSVDSHSGGLKCGVFKSGQFLFLHLFVKKTMMSLNHSCK